MAKSSARKHREHLVRQGKWNPLQDRGTWWGVNPIAKVTPTKKEKLERSDKKYRLFG
jgi:hypothetical protein